MQNPERRQEGRRRVLKGGKVFYDHYAVSLDCMIRNESKHGMQIKFDPNVTLPRNFALLNRKDGTLADVEVIWAKAGEMGVQLKEEMRDVRSFGRSDIRRMSIIATRG